MSIHWFVLFVACITEVMWALSLKLIQLKTTPWLIAAAMVLTVLNMLLLSFAMRGIPAAAAYAVWTGLGAVGVTLAGTMLLGESLSLPQLAFLACIVVGVVGLKMHTV